eukprot:1041551-Rhodomonas_salina.1
MVPVVSKNLGMEDLARELTDIERSLIQVGSVRCYAPSRTASPGSVLTPRNGVSRVRTRVDRDEHRTPGQPRHRPTRLRCDARY